MSDDILLLRLEHFITSVTFQSHTLITKTFSWFHRSGDLLLVPPLWRWNNMCWTLYVQVELTAGRKSSRLDRMYQFWQEGVHPKRIQDDAMMIQKIERIHHNPVRRGYVDEPAHWRYSSARNYLEMGGLWEVC